jgi:hypothetical protein
MFGQLDILIFLSLFNSSNPSPVISSHVAMYISSKLSSIFIPSSDTFGQSSIAIYVSDDNTLNVSSSIFEQKVKCAILSFTKYWSPIVSILSLSSIMIVSRSDRYDRPSLVTSQKLISRYLTFHIWPSRFK